jgi:hypothetical protein
MSTAHCPSPPGQRERCFVDLGSYPAATAQEKWVAMDVADPAAPSQTRKVRIFESYGWRDAAEVAQRLKDSLLEAGFDVWIDREHLRADDKHFSIALEKAVTESEVVVALLSPHAARGQADQDERSSICYNELRLADELPRPIVPVRVRKLAGPPPFLVIKYRRIDWLNWEEPQAYRKGVGEIVAAIERVLANDKNFDPDIAFQATNFAPQLRTARDDFVGREWLFARIDAWLGGDRPCFLIGGATGSGKTAIVAELVRRNPGGRILAYHFCSGTPMTLDPAAFVRSLAGMLANSVDAYAELLWNGRLAAWLTAADPQTMLSQGVLAPLHGIAMDGRYYVIVDGLDEAIGVGTFQPSLPQLLAGAVEEFPPWLKLLVTTRPHGRVQRMFQTAETCLLADEDSGQRPDVRSYLDRRLVAPALEAAVEPGARAALADVIERGAAGSFQYARSVLDAIAAGEIDIERLDELPDRLEAFYFSRAQRRFPNPADYRSPRAVLGLLLAAREALTLRQLATLSGLDADIELRPALDALNCFVNQEAGPDGEDVFRLAHKSITDWLLSGDAGAFRVAPQRERLLTHCRSWRENGEDYALKHVVAHLLEAGLVSEAAAAVGDGLFLRRLARFGEPRLDAEDSRALVLALVATRDAPAILSLARTVNTWQRDGVAAALQSTPPQDLEFVDRVVRVLLDAQA